MTPRVQRIARATILTVGLLGSIATLVQSMPSTKSRLRYAEAPRRRLVFDDALLRDYELVTGASRLRSPVWAARVVLWNDSDVPVRPPFYRPVRISLGHGARILHAAVAKQSAPDICRITVDERLRDGGSVDLLWQTLEKNDGGAIDVVYTGEKNAPLRVDGAFEGQRGIEKRSWIGWKSAAVFQVVFLAVCGLWSVVITFFGSAAKSNLETNIWRMAAIVVLLCVFYVAFDLWRAAPGELMDIF